MNQIGTVFGVHFKSLASPIEINLLDSNGRCPICIGPKASYMCSIVTLNVHQALLRGELC